MRFKGGEKDKMALKMQDARKTFIKSYEQMNVRVRGLLRAIEKDVYEKDHPGRIEAKKMKVRPSPIKQV
jgi:hypothetical protein